MDAEDAVRWRSLRALAFAAAGLLVPFGVRVGMDGNLWGGTALGVGGLVALLGFLASRRRGSMVRSGNFLSGVLVLSLTIASLSRGGIEATAMQWVILVPVAATLLGRMRVAQVWCGIGVLAHVALAVAELYGYAPERSVPTLGSRVLSGSALIVVALWLSTQVQNATRARHETFSQQAMAGQKLESVGRLAGGIAHDFNNVLAVVLARSDDALHHLSPDDPQYENFTAIRLAARRGASLASELVAFSRRGPATYDVLRPNDVLQDVEQVFARLARENIEVDVVVEQEVGPVEGDRDHLVQVLLNLCINAQDAMPAGGRLRLELRTDVVSSAMQATTGVVEPGTYAVMTVADEGIGMSASTQARIFEPFFTTKERGLGSGIGLATVHVIIKQHGGQLRVESTLGQGTAFDVYLPLTSRSDELPEHVESDDGLGRASALRVLLVEDDELVRHALETMLGRGGYRVTTAANGAEAIGRWSEGPFDVVLTDVLMPGMTGPDLVRQLQKLDPQVRVVYMSGHVEDAMSDVDLERDDALFLRKPASRAAVLAAIEQAAAPRPSAADQLRPEPETRREDQSSQ